MAVKILLSVGKGGINRRDDVVLVQNLLNCFVMRLMIPMLRVDGQAGPRTIAAITAFQTNILRLRAPDGRVDPNGRTFIALAGGAGQTLLATAPLRAAVGGAPRVIYSSTVPSASRLVSGYAIKVIEKALVMSGMSAAVITSTLRLPAEQAAIMYRNAVKDLLAQKQLYGANGGKVLDVFESNRTKTQNEVIKLMVEKIEELAKQGFQVSNHVSTPERYAKRNIIDIGVNSTRSEAGKSFDMTKLTLAFRKVETEGFIARFIDETTKSNTCWHLEIVPDVKALT
jgi:peptidoglycan hydrolase-like protein with peptidoglycan-binding domain